MERLPRRTKGPEKASRPQDPRRDTDVLVVEADPEQQVALAHALRHQGLRVVAASSAAGALALTQTFPVDLVLVSQELPQTTGIDVTRTLLSYRPSLRVLVLTSEGSPGLCAAAREAGAEGCLPRAHVQSAVHRWVERADRGPGVAATAFGMDVEVAAQSAE